MIRDELIEDMKQAMKTGNTIYKNTIQLIRSAVLLEEKNKQKILNDTEVQEIILKERNKRYDALADFQKAKRNDLIEQTHKEIMCINKYLPQPISEYDLEQEMKKIITELNATKKDLGVVIRKTKEQFGARTTGATISEIAKKLLEV